MRTNIFSSVIGTEYFKDKMFNYSPSSLVAYYRLGETSGTDAVDETGNYNGTYVNDYTSVAGLVGQDTDGAISFDITDSPRINLSVLAPVITAKSRYTFVFTFQTTLKSGAGNPLLCMYTAADATRLIKLETNNDGHVALFRNGMSNLYSSGVDYADGKRHTIRLTVDNEPAGTTHGLWVDGIRVGGAESGYTDGYNAENIYINASAINYGTNIIDEILVYDWHYSMEDGEDLYYNYLFRNFFQTNEVVSLADSNAINRFIAALLSDNITVTESTLVSYVMHLVLNETIISSDHLYTFAQEIVHELTSHADSITVINHIKTALKEVITDTTVITDQMVMLQNVAELINVLDTNLLQWLLTLSENIGVQETVDTLYKFLTSINELTNHTDNSQYSVYIVAVVHDNINVTDTVTPSNIFKVLLHDIISLSGGIDLGGGEYYTFVANTKTLGLSEYISYDFNSLSDGLAVNATGIYQLSDDDSNEQVEAEIRTGLLDFGTSKHKQIVYAYLGLTNDDNIIFKTNTIQNGIRKERFYKLTPSTAATDTRRVQLGKGVKGDLWQFAITNVDGADFSLDELEVLPLVLTRRI